jgi:hypothetical protein
VILRHSIVVGKDDDSHDWVPHDPVPPEHVEHLKRMFQEAHFRRDQRLAAEAALDAVLHDAEQVRGVRPTMEVVFSHDRFRIAYPLERHTIEEPTEGLNATNVTDALVEVADAVFDLLADEDIAVPFECPEHGFGLHPRTEDGVAVWWCEPSGHVVARIGYLGEH